MKLKGQKLREGEMEGKGKPSMREEDWGLTVFRAEVIMALLMSLWFDPC